MMTYEFKCMSCDEEFELQSTISRYTGEADCPECGKMSTRHFRTAPSLDTYFIGSTKDQHPVPGI